MPDLRLFDSWGRPLSFREWLRVNRAHPDVTAAAARLLGEEYRGQHLHRTAAVSSEPVVRAAWTRYLRSAPPDARVPRDRNGS